MEIVIFQVFVSLLLGAGSLLLYAYSAKARDSEHNDRLALLPLEDDGTKPADPSTPTRTATSTSARETP